MIKDFFKKTDINKSLIGITVVLYLLMYLCGVLFFGDQGFTKPQVFLNIFINNAGLIVTSAAMTMVMISGGIDISVGAMTALNSVILGDLMMNHGWNAWAAMAAVLLVGIIHGFIQGFFISYLRLQPFAVTLVGMFFCRGLAAVISSEVISVTEKTFTAISQYKINIIFLGRLNKHGKMIYPFIYPSVIIALLLVLLVFLMLRYTAFGRSIYAVGGNERAATLMGLNVRKIILRTYMIDGFLVSVGGILFCMNTMSCFSDQAKGLEMDAIASTVVGGTLLDGGVGNVFGTLLGCMIKGTSETFISFDGSLSSWWVKISTAVLLSFFILLQSFLRVRSAKECSVENL
nr:sugar ABC transporter permease YjfF [Lachnospiraceae bacterium C1.1]